MFTVGPTFFSSPAATPPVTDPYWTDVLLLLNGQGTILTDASSFNNTMSSNGGAVLNSVQPLFSYPTYSIPNDGNSSRVSMNNGFFAGKYGSNEWCIETWYYPTESINVDGRFFSFGGVSMKRDTLAKLTANVFINGSSIGIGSANGDLPTGSWTNIALVRDNTSDPVFSLLKLFVNGNLVNTVGGIGKTNAMDNTGFGFILGYNDFGSFGYFSNFRVTRNHARYYTSFTPAAAPFPTS